MRKILELLCCAPLATACEAGNLEALAPRFAFVRSSVSPCLFRLHCFLSLFTTIQIGKFVSRGAYVPTPHSSITVRTVFGLSPQDRQDGKCLRASIANLATSIALAFFRDYHSCIGFFRGIPL